VHFVLDLLKPAKRRERRFVNRRSLLEVNVLGEQTQFQSSRPHYFTAIRRLFAGDEAKDGCFAGAVSTDKPNVLARINL
jgi:hypothetical protein